MPDKPVHYYFIQIRLTDGHARTTRVKTSNELLAFSKVMKALRKVGTTNVKSLTLVGTPLNVKDCKGNVPRIAGGSMNKKPKTTDYIAVTDGQTLIEYKHRETGERISLEQYAELDW